MALPAAAIDSVPTIEGVPGLSFLPFGSYPTTFQEIFAWVVSNFNLQSYGMVPSGQIAARSGTYPQFSACHALTIFGFYQWLVCDICADRQGALFAL